MAFDFLFGFIGIIVLTAFCLPGAFMVPSIAYWFMTPYACGILKEYGIKKKTGKTPEVMRVDPQWDGKEFLKLALEVVISVVLAWLFIRFE